MSTFAEHVQQAVRNENLANIVDEQGDHDWAVTLLYYAATHLIDAYFVQNGRAMIGEAQREAVMRESADLQPVLGSYRLLRTFSENAREHCYHFNSLDYEEIKRQHYQTLAAHVLSKVRTAP